VDPFTGAIWTDQHAIYPNRTYDHHSRQWLSPDPVTTPPATPGAASAHTYNYYDNVNYIDPTGLKPLSDAEFQEWKNDYNQGFVTSAIDAVPDWVFTGLVVAVGVGLCFTPFAVVGAGILIGAGTTAAIGAATGTFSFDAVTMGGLIGGAGALTGMGVAAAVSKTSLTTRVVAAGAGDALYDTGVQYAQTGTITATNTLISFATGTTASSIGETLAIRRALNNTPAPGTALNDLPTTNLVAPQTTPGSGVVKYDPELVSRQMLGQNTPGSTGFGVTPGGRTVSAHAAERVSTGGPGRPPTSLSTVDDILDTGTSVRFDPIRDTIQVRAPQIPGKPFVVVDSGGTHVVTVMVPK